VIITVTVSGETVPEGIANTYLAEAAQGVYSFLRDYHSAFEWRGPRWLPRGASGQFAREVVNGWQQPVIEGDTAVIRNTFGLLAWKVTGGTITPKQAKALTIPLTVPARAKAASQFEGLFRTGNALSIKLGNRIEAQYALTQSVNQKPWPGALPPDEAVAEAANAAAIEAASREMS